MQLDNTRIAVRERGMIDTLDLTLHVIRAFAPRLFPALLMGILPFALINQILLGWMWEEPDPINWGNPEEAAGGGILTALIQAPQMTRYGWLYLMLLFFQGPAATIFAVSYLGGAVFKQDKTLWDTVRDVASAFWPFFVCQLLMRGTLVATALPLFALSMEINYPVEVVLPIFLFLWVAALRAFRPYINEIIVLEKNPLRSKSSAMTVGRRSSFLHTSSGGELFGQWFASCLFAFVLLHLVFWSMWCVYVVMFGDSNLMGWVPQMVLRPIALWTVVAFMGVARFLSYLDLRIRQEGWEVELLVRAEAARLAEKLV